MSTIWQRCNTFRSSTFFITTVICYSVLVDQIFFAFILPVLPYSLPERNGISEDRVQYWTAIEIVVFGVACLVACRWWTDLYPSRRWPFLAGLVVLLASTLIMWLANPISLQIFSRVLQGIADAMIYIVGMAIIIDTVSARHTAEYMGYLTIAMNIGTFAGPLLGGAVYEGGGYHAVFGMMLGFVLLDAILRVSMSEKTHTDSSEGIEASRTSLEGDNHFKDHGGPTLSAQSSFSERTTPDKEPRASLRAKLPHIVNMLASPRLLTALLGTCVQAAIFSGFETVLSVYVQDIWNFTALGAGLMFIPLTISSFFAPIFGRIVDRTSPRWSLVAGFLGMCPTIVLVRFVTYDSIGQKVLLCFFLVIIGIGITMTLCPLTAEISLVAETFTGQNQRQRTTKGGYGGGAYAQAYALFAMAWSAGNIAGPLLCGLIKDEAGWGTMCWSLGLISGLTAVPCFIWSGNRKAVDS